MRSVRSLSRLSRVLSTQIPSARTVQVRLISASPRVLSSSASSTQPERREFQAETAKLLDIVAKSLYSDSEVFVRELISNSSDAIEKRRLANLDSGESHNGEIKITDNGIGMTKDELVSYLGTIAHSGSKAFVQENAEKAENVIGQFGVGFYSAFMVADRVEVRTRKVGEQSGIQWMWNGGNSYEMSEGVETPEGTTILIHLKKGDAELYAQFLRMKDIIEKYSYFVSAPIILNEERVNSLNAIWTANPKEADSPLSIRSIMYIPSHRVSQMEFATQGEEYGLSLYARRVLIKAKAKELLPKYLRFVIGVVDCEDIPLNLSREMLQNDPVVTKLRRVLTDKILGFFVQQMKKDPIKYNDIYKNINLYLKEGIVLEPEQNVKEDIARLLQLETSNSRAGTMTSLTDYISRMQEGQKDIYYMYAPSRQLAESSPYLEVVKGEGKEVLFLLDPADEVVFLSLGQFKGHNLVSVEKWAEKAEDKTEDKKDERGDKKELYDWVKNTLGSVKVNEVKASRRASEHPAMISVQTEMGAARHFLRVGETKIYDNALLTAGLMTDSRNMIPRLNDLLTKLLGKEKSTILTP
ncbi:hsp-75 [Pristionchus pacificus]|uniref:Hsp-75 n=1 Tax=Pristionchus pacificus TaxID=54126 RepID=A0A2A6BAN5_PRIPA|nr:hsp-75 [Pristionchus pacificus]|eukprot:PDM62926.1 hsp-75 [Pristionchus pacificus]